MRRSTVAIVALLAVLGSVGAAQVPAAAHFCSTPLEVPVGRPVTFTVGVPAEDAAVGRVEIEIPPAFDLHRAVEYPGWQVEREGDLVTYTGGPIYLFQCGFFTLAGEASEETTLVVPFTTYARDGTKIREFRSSELNHLDAAQVVYAGIERDAALEEGHGGTSRLLAVAGWVLIGLAGGAAGLAVVRRRKGGAAR